jgi:hypothetical protein
MAKNSTTGIIRTMCRNNVSVEQMGVIETAGADAKETVEAYFGGQIKVCKGEFRDGATYLYVYAEPMTSEVTPDVEIAVDDYVDDTMVYLYEIS